MRHQWRRICLSARAYGPLERHSVLQLRTEPVAGPGVRVSQSRRWKRLPCVFWILLSAHRLSDPELDVPAAIRRRGDGHCRSRLADVSMAAALKESLPLQPPARDRRRRIADTLAARDGCKRGTMEGAGAMTEVRTQNFYAR